MIWWKRLMDITLVLIMSLVLVPVLLGVLVLLWRTEERPFFYVSERMRAPGQPFGLIKLRTMSLDSDRVGGVTGGDKQARISRIHRRLRRTRGDEIPQLWNVLTGDMSLVGPRPPLRVYVEDYPDLYAAVLQSRPGITGLASLRLHAREEVLLAACTTPAQTDAVYRRRCIPRKAQLDLIYGRNRNFCWDLKLIAQTAVKPFRRGH
mgnify:CR=1 FL=1|jgi:lipopolysaccharide/colanic/teichoic acid biosynthesis glycosyltransferase